MWACRCRRRRPADDVEDRPFPGQGQARGNRRAAGRRDERPHLLRNAGTASTTACTPARACWKSCRATPTRAPLEALPQDVSTPELKLEMEEGQPFTLVRALQDHGQFPGASRVVTIDGVRAGIRTVLAWLASNTTPVVVLRFRAPKHWPVSRPISAGNWLNWRQVLLCPSRTCQCNCPIALPGTVHCSCPRRTRRGEQLRIINAPGLRLT